MYAKAFIPSDAGGDILFPRAILFPLCGSTRSILRPLHFGIFIAYLAPLAESAPFQNIAVAPAIPKSMAENRFMDEKNQH